MTLPDHTARSRSRDTAEAGPPRSPAGAGTRTGLSRRGVLVGG
jgi:hypothetical protein